MSRLETKRKIASWWPTKSHNRKIILLYHSIGNSLWGMPESLFCQQMDWLMDHCRVISLTDLIHSNSDETIQVAITFDDGYQCLHNTVMPLLTERKMCATVYINTGWMGEDDNNRKKSVADLGHYPDEAFLTWPEVKNLYHAGWEIGSHGVNHYNFTRTSQEITQQELAQSKAHIEKIINTECMHFAYPWGLHSNNVKKIAKKSGYQFAAAARHASINSFSDSFALPRMNIEREYSFEDFKNIIKGKWDYLGLIHRIKGL